MSGLLSESPSTAGLVLRHAGEGHLVAEVDGAPVSVRLRQCFPWSEPHRHLSLRDGEDREVALVEDPAEAGFVFRVTRVHSIDEEVEIRHWRVDTEQGARSFQTHLDEWPQALPTGGLLMRDVAGDLYRLPAPIEMDRHSRQLLWAYVD